MDIFPLILVGLALLVGFIGVSIWLQKHWRLMIRITIIVGMFVLGMITAYLLAPRRNIEPVTATPEYAIPTATPIPFVEIVVTVQELHRGMRIPQYGAVQLRPWPAGPSVPFNALTNVDDVVGLLARVDIPRESPVLSTMLVRDYDNLASTGPIPFMPPLRGTLRYDQAVSGEINHLVWMENWYFTGGAGETATFTMEATGGELAPFIMLWNHATGEWIDGQRHFEGQTTSITVTLPQDAIYVISATRARINNGSTSGTYRLIASAGYLTAP